MDRGAQNNAKKNSNNHSGKKQQNGSGLVIMSALIVAAVAILLMIFVARSLGNSAGLYDETVEAGADSGAGTADETAAALDGAAGETAVSDAAGETTETEAGGAAAIENPIYADITVENYGTITVALDAASAPVTVLNFITLAGDGFYDGLTFHRIIDGFMMQGGDPEGTGRGGSDETILGEFAANGYDNPLSHTRGAISMARSQDYNSASSQFFIVQSDSTFLDGEYAAFGYVTSGMEYVDQICKDAKPTDGNGSIAKEDQPVITSIVIRQE